MTRVDVAVIVLAAAFVGALAAARLTPSAQADTVVITVSGHRYATLPLDVAREVKVPGRIGTSVIQIAHERTRFVSSPCTGKICVHTGWLSRSGEIAICLPNAVSVELTGTRQEFDSINF